jgi:hypothetical protein
VFHRASTTLTGRSIKASLLLASSLPEFISSPTVTTGPRLRHAKKQAMLPATPTRQEHNPSRLGESFSLLLRPSLCYWPRPRHKPSIAKSTLKSHLEDATAQILGCINRRDWTSIYWQLYIEENIRFRFERLDGPSIIGRENYVRAFDRHTARQPNYWCHIVNMSTAAHEKSGTAAVWASLMITGHPPMVQRENVTVIR